MIEHNSSSDGIDPGLAGLSISYALQVNSYLYETKAELFVLWDQITQSLNWIVRMTNELEVANIVAVKTTKEYAELPNEVCISYTSNYSVRLCRHQQPFIMKTAHLLIGWAQVALSLSITPLGIERNLIW